MSFENNFVVCKLENKTFYMIVKKSVPENDTEFDELMDHIKNFYKASEIANLSSGMIIDVREIGFLDMKYYQTFADYFSNNKEIIQNHFKPATLIHPTSIISDK